MTTSVTVVNMLPTLDKWLPYPNNDSIEVDEGHSIEFTCIYNASTNRNVTMATWNFKEDYLKHNSSRHTMTTEYGTDPANAKRILSRLILSNVVPDDAGTYTCQCVYNSDIIYNKETFCSGTESFHVKVKPKVKSGQHYYYEVSCALVFLCIGYTLYIIIGGTVGLVLAVLSMISVKFLIWRRQKMRQSKTENRATSSDEADQSDDENRHTDDENDHNNDQNGHNSGQNTNESDQSSDNECAPLMHKS